MMEHFLQSKAWQQFQARLGRTCVSDKGDDWSYRAYLEKGTGNTRLYAPYGPAVTDKISFDAAVASLKTQGLKHGASFIRIEPTTGVTVSDLHSMGFKPVTYQQLNPARTQVIDLTVSREAILQGMSQNSRNLTRNYHKKGISVSVSSDPSDVTIFTALMKRVAKRNNIVTHSSAYFKAQAEALFPIGAARLYVARINKRPVAASLVYDSTSTRYYAHAAADDEYRKLAPGTALVGQMILDAKDEGKTSFDLYGIAPPDSPAHPWHGLTRFKQSFGGSPVDYLGSWDLPLKPVKYASYRSYQSLRRRLRR